MTTLARARCYTLQKIFKPLKIFTPWVTQQNRFESESFDQNAIYRQELIQGDVTAAIFLKQACQPEKHACG